ACRPGFYKASSGNVKCSKCPPHSYTHQEGSVHCGCEKNYFRAEEDPASMACSRPPSAPRNVISAINETSVILDWIWPADSGGRKDVIFNVVCKRCWPGPRQCEPCRGSAHTNYTFEIEAQNAVSSQAPTIRHYAAVTITTNQAGESVIPIVKGIVHITNKSVNYSHSCCSEPL
ncbi:hypothetical protein PO909_033775, partial [Leuciscus waleckii]